MSSKATILQDPPVTEKAVRTTPRPTEEQIAQRAHEIFLKRGATPGSELDDWLQAERELTAEAKQPVAPKPSAPSKAPLANSRSRR
jgi:Protein of unknown function (DUF2934)